MINLKNTSGLDIQFNADRRKVIVADNVIVSAIAQKKLQQMQPVIINDNLICPEIFYTIYAHLFRKKDSEMWKNSTLVYDLTFMLPNLAGIEFVKTFGHYNDINSNNKYGTIELIEIVYGAGAVIIQRARKKANYVPGTTIDKIYSFDELDEIYILKVTKGDKLLIPPGYGYTLINTKNQILVAGTLSSKNRIPVCDPYLDMHGAGYYLIRKNARQEIVKNPKYKILPKIKKIKPVEFNKLLNIKSSQPLYTQATKTPEKFGYLKNSNNIFEI